MANYQYDNSIRVDGIEIYTSPIYAAIDEYIQEHNNIDLVTDVDQYRWKSVLYYIHDKVFTNRDDLKRKDRNNNAYDYELLSDIYDIYKRLCVEYGKITMLADFSIMTGIDDAIMSTWSNPNGHSGVNVAGSNLHKKIMRDNENGVSTMMISSGRNPVGYMAILNHYHGWSTTAAANGTVERRKTPDEIAAAHGVALEDGKKTLPAANFTELSNNSND